MTEFEAPQWDVPGWNWAPGDNAWLDAGVYENGVSIFFIHGGRVRHQAHIPEGHYTLAEFTKLFNEKARGLDDPFLFWTEDSGGGDAGLWIEGTRAPNEDDLTRLQAAREHQRREDHMSLHFINERRAAQGLPPLEPATASPEPSEQKQA